MNDSPLNLSPQPRRRFLGRFRDWIHHHPRRAIVAAVIGVIVAGGLITAAVLAINPHPPETTPIKLAPTPQPAPVTYYSPLTGVKVADEATTKLPVTGIMIENSPDARPQSGLKQAGIVYEAIAEGGITRFLALYQESKPTLIGPVRSLRMYYLDWATPYQASITHFGGSAASLAEVAKGSYRNLDLMRDGQSYYWRATDRYAPHNVYTNFTKLDALNTSKGYTTSSFTGFNRTDGEPAETQNAKDIDVTFSSTLYNPHYDYDAKSNTYLRSVGGSASKDREKGRLAPNVVVAMYINMSTVMQDGYREDITTSGAGKAYVFQNGTVTKATWSKKSRTSPLQLLDSDGNSLALDRGQTWIEAVPNGSGGVSWR